MGLIVNNKTISLSTDQPESGRRRFSRDNTYISWGINAMVRYWHSNKPSEFKYNRSMENPITEEEKKAWGII